MDQPDPDMPMGARRRADAMVGLFVVAIVALLAGIALFATGGSTSLGAGLVVVALLAGLGGLVLVRSISPEDRARLTAPTPEAPTDDT